MTTLTCGCDLDAGVHCETGKRLWQHAGDLLATYHKSQKADLFPTVVADTWSHYCHARATYEAHVTAVVESSP